MRRRTTQDKNMPAAPLGFLKFIKKKLSAPRSKEEAEHLKRGRHGEKIAAKFLRKKGFRILRRNFKPSHGGEIDIVCRDEEILVFVEVKSRANETFGRPSAAVDSGKRLRIIHGAMAWLRLLDMPDITFRFDIVEIVADSDLTHIENAFALPEPYHY